MLRLFTARSSTQAASCLRRGIRLNSTDVKPPMLARLREDMKAAMRARDKPRLNVVKGIISDMNNAAVPIKDDVGVVNVIAKKIKALDQAAAEYKEAGRQDLADEAAGEKAILAEYQGLVKMMTNEEIEQYVLQAIRAVEKEGKKPQVGTVFKLLFGPEGSLKDKPVRKQSVNDIFNKLSK
ncbi:hypothetical protein KEM56_000025 [Ascosphaera pollenicola]|nr:hypothetical protein KEM56_000025 [Ascosphaera pollenicola]